MINILDKDKVKKLKNYKDIINKNFDNEEKDEIWLHLVRIIYKY